MLEDSDHRAVIYPVDFLEADTIGTGGQQVLNKLLSLLFAKVANVETKERKHIIRAYTELIIKANRTSE